MQTSSSDLYWVDTFNLGKSGFVQSRLHYDKQHMNIAEVQMHGGAYCVEFTVRSSVYNPIFPTEYTYFDSLDEAKAWAITIARFTLT